MPSLVGFEDAARGHVAPRALPARARVGEVVVEVAERVWYAVVEEA